MLRRWRRPLLPRVRDARMLLSALTLLASGLLISVLYYEVDTMMQGLGMLSYCLGCCFVIFSFEGNQ